MTFSKRGSEALEVNLCPVSVNRLLTPSLADDKTLPLWKLTVAASLAGGLGGIAGNPADILLVRMARLSLLALRYTNGSDLSRRVTP